MPPQQSKISGKHVFLYSPGLKEHIPVFIIIFRPKLQELRGVEVVPPVDRDQNIPAVPPYLPEFSSVTNGTNTKRGVSCGPRQTLIMQSL